MANPGKDPRYPSKTANTSMSYLYSMKSYPVNFENFVKYGERLSAEVAITIAMIETGTDSHLRAMLPFDFYNGESEEHTLMIIQIKLFKS